MTTIKALGKKFRIMLYRFISVRHHNLLFYCEHQIPNLANHTLGRFADYLSRPYQDEIDAMEYFDWEQERLELEIEKFSNNNFA